MKAYNRQCTTFGNQKKIEMAEGQWARKDNKEETEHEQGASHQADLVKERRQGSYQFLGKPCHCPVTMATTRMPRMAQAASRDIQAENKDKEERKGNVSICGHMY